jgi:hypothetical protein
MKIMIPPQTLHLLYLPLFHYYTPLSRLYETKIMFSILTPDLYYTPLLCNTLVNVLLLVIPLHHLLHLKVYFKKHYSDAFAFRIQSRKAL